ncbi:13587_t:CDS:2 [Dentiscutata heterogama]|uniref:13587_t:CDS:1 n=1 Tax=Dentiscutata heterogama TaxID=1316150 RepID=A0ACA9MDV6_9GLOM|nr:13587_t:CDS:2 [Dentiscutata heterogama]
MPPSNETPIHAGTLPSEPVVDEGHATRPTTDPNTNDTDKSTKPVDPPQSPPIPSFAFPQNLRNIYISPVTNLSTILTSNDSTRTTEDLTPKWDEICFQWCKQQDKSREHGINPNCRMVCFRKINNNMKEEFFKKKLVVHKEQDRINKTENVAQVLYGKEGDDEQEGVKYSQAGPRNFLDGYFIYYIKGLEGCQKHTENMKNDELLNRTSWPQVNPEEYEIDLGEKFERTKTETNRIIKRAFTPGYQLGKRYIESWSDGTQAAFFKRFYESVQRMDAVHMVQDNVKKVVEVWVKGSGGGNGKGGFTGNSSPNDSDHKNNDKSENDDESNNENDK